MSNATEHEASQEVEQGIDRDGPSGRHRAAAPVDSGQAVTGRHRDEAAEPASEASAAEEPAKRRWFSRG